MASPSRRGDPKGLPCPNAGAESAPLPETATPLAGGALCDPEGGLRLPLLESNEELSELFESQLFGPGSGWQGRPQEGFFGSLTRISCRKVIH